MNNDNMKIDIQVNDHMNHKDFFLGVAVGTAIIPALYGIYSKVKMLKSEKAKIKELEKEMTENGMFDDQIFYNNY